MVPYYVTVQVKGPTPEIIMERVKRHKTLIKRQLQVAGRMTRDTIKDIIKQNTKRSGSTGNLANSIATYYEETPNGYFVGVGHMPTMFNLAPYWYVVNYGAHFPGTYQAAAEGVKGAPFVPPPNYGHFNGEGPIAGLPVAGEIGPRWTHTGDKGDYLIVPRKFRPMNYIEKTNVWLSAFWRQFWSTQNIG
jgi:hypothetical protein